jgi:cellulose biosynthesis protein BcsQ
VKKGKASKKRPRKRSSVAEAPLGRFITFYSYKGGTGRSMALANVAWVLASNGARVLVIDWDLEAPGLHRYFHPFIEDKQLGSSEGIIDFLVHFVEGSRLSHESEPNDDNSWFEDYANLLPYAFSLEWEFPNKGTLDFVPAGQQGAGYGVRVTQFNWEAFYKDLGGGVFLETLKERLRREYDYILIDSRTGISDTSGICTVQMPDDMVVCFTLNNQSIEGAAAVADSAFSQRRKPSGEPGLRVWPVPMRVELAEKDRLETARQVAQQTFDGYLLHLKREDRRAYWEGIEVPYDPYFAYEEVLASFAERRRSKLSVLDSFLTLTRHVTSGKVTSMPPVAEALRQETLAKFSRPRLSAQHDAKRSDSIDLVHVEPDRHLAAQIGSILDVMLSQLTGVVGNRIVLQNSPGSMWGTPATSFETVTAILVLVTPHLMRSLPWSTYELDHGVRSGTPIIPILVGVSQAELLGLGTAGHLAYVQGLQLPPNPDLFGQGQHLMFQLALRLNEMLPKPTVQILETDPEDPQKGMWGGKQSQNGRKLSAEVNPVSNDWFEIALEVSGTTKAPLKGEVEFHLHPTFSPPIRRVQVEDGKAKLKLFGWGAFTVGALIDEGSTKLELNLAKVPDAPQIFRDR